MTKQKFLIFALAGAAVALAYFSFYISLAGLAFGFLAGRFGGGKRTGVPGRVKSLTFSWRRYEFHLHHWSLSSLCMSICGLSGFYLFNPQVFFGFLGGLVVQGIYCYSDWHSLVRIKSPALA